MVSDWEVVPLSTIATVKSGKRLPLGETLTSQRTPHPYVRLVDIDNNRIRKENIQYLEPRVQKSISRYIVQKGDVCLAIVGHTIGLVFQVNEQWDGANLTENAARLTDFRGADPAYIFSYLRSQLGQDLIKSHIVGSAQGKLPLYAIASFPIPLPPLAEQKAIAALLGALDDKIELNRRMNSTLETMARALFQSWFVDFDPVRAKLDGRKPVGMDEATAALFPDSFEDSEAGHIPTGWKPLRLPDAIEVNPRRTLKKDIVAPYLDMKNLPTQGHSAEEVIDRVFSSGTKFQNGDTLLARITPCLENGKTGYVDFLEDGQVGWGSTEYIVLTPKSPLPPQFGYLLARSDALRSHAIQNMTGTSGRQRVPSECFNTFWLAVPPSEIARRFGDITAPLMTKIKANSTESRTLANLRDTLLPKLLSGELSLEGMNTRSDTA